MSQEKGTFSTWTPPACSSVCLPCWGPVLCPKNPVSASSSMSQSSGKRSGTTREFGHFSVLQHLSSTVLCHWTLPADLHFYILNLVTHIFSILTPTLGYFLLSSPQTPLIQFTLLPWKLGADSVSAYTNHLSLNWVPCPGHCSGDKWELIAYAPSENKPTFCKWNKCKTYSLFIY